MNYTEIYAALILWAQTLTSPAGDDPDEGLPFYRASVAWDQAPGVGEIRVTTERPAGQDFETHEYRAIDDDTLHTAEGPRALVVEFRVTSIDQFEAETAEQRLSLLRVRAAKASSRAILKPAFLSVASVGQLVPVAATDENGHTLSVATVDVTFNAYASDAEGAESGSYIDTVVASSDLSGAPPDAEWDEEVIGG